MEASQRACPSCGAITTTKFCSSCGACAFMKKSDEYIIESLNTFDPQTLRRRARREKKAQQKQKATSAAAVVMATDVTPNKTEAFHKSRPFVTSAAVEFDVEDNDEHPPLMSALSSLRGLMALDHEQAVTAKAVRGTELVHKRARHPARLPKPGQAADGRSRIGESSGGGDGGGHEPAGAVKRQRDVWRPMGRVRPPPARLLLQSGACDGDSSIADGDDDDDHYHPLVTEPPMMLTAAASRKPRQLHDQLALARSTTPNLMQRSRYREGLVATRAVAAARSSGTGNGGGDDHEKSSQFFSRASGGTEDDEDGSISSSANLISSHVSKRSLLSPTLNPSSSPSPLPSSSPPTLTKAQTGALSQGGVMHGGLVFVSAGWEERLAAEEEEKRALRREQRGKEAEEAARQAAEAAEAAGKEPPKGRIEVFSRELKPVKRLKLTKKGDLQKKKKTGSNHKNRSTQLKKGDDDLNSAVGAEGAGEVGEGFTIYDCVANSVADSVANSVANSVDGGPGVVDEKDANIGDADVEGGDDNAGAEEEGDDVDDTSEDGSDSDGIDGDGREEVVLTAVVSIDLSDVDESWTLCIECFDFEGPIVAVKEARLQQEVEFEFEEGGHNNEEEVQVEGVAAAAAAAAASFPVVASADIIATAETNTASLLSLEIEERSKDPSSPPSSSPPSRPQSSPGEFAASGHYHHSSNLANDRRRRRGIGSPNSLNDGEEEAFDMEMFYIEEDYGGRSRGGSAGSGGGGRSDGRGRRGSGGSGGRRGGSGFDALFFPDTPTQGNENATATSAGVGFWSEAEEAARVQKNGESFGIRNDEQQEAAAAAAAAARPSAVVFELNLSEGEVFAFIGSESVTMTTTTTTTTTTAAERQSSRGRSRGSSRNRSRGSSRGSNSNDLSPIRVSSRGRSRESSRGSSRGSPNRGSNSRGRSRGSSCGNPNRGSNSRGRSRGSSRGSAGGGGCGPRSPVRSTAATTTTTSVPVLDRWVHPRHVEYWDDSPQGSKAFQREALALLLDRLSAYFTFKPPASPSSPSSPSQSSPSPPTLSRNLEGGGDDDNDDDEEPLCLPHSVASTALLKRFPSPLTFAHHNCHQRQKQQRQQQRLVVRFNRTLARASCRLPWGPRSKRRSCPAMATVKLLDREGKLAVVVAPLRMPVGQMVTVGDKIKEEAQAAAATVATTESPPSSSTTDIVPAAVQQSTSSEDVNDEEEDDDGAGGNGGELSNGNDAGSSGVDDDGGRSQQFPPLVLAWSLVERALSLSEAFSSICNVGDGTSESKMAATPDGSNGGGGFGNIGASSSPSSFVAPSPLRGVSSFKEEEEEEHYGASEHGGDGTGPPPSRGLGRGGVSGFGPEWDFLFGLGLETTNNTNADGGIERGGSRVGKEERMVVESSASAGITRSKRSDGSSSSSSSMGFGRQPSPPDLSSDPTTTTTTLHDWMHAPISALEASSSAEITASQAVAAASTAQAVARFCALARSGVVAGAAGALVRGGHLAIEPTNSGPCVCVAGELPPWSVSAWAEVDDDDKDLRAEEHAALTLQTMGRGQLGRQRARAARQEKEKKTMMEEEEEQQRLEREAKEEAEREEKRMKMEEESAQRVLKEMAEKEEEEEEEEEKRVAAAAAAAAKMEAARVEESLRIIAKEKEAEEEAARRVRDAAAAKEAAQKEKADKDAKAAAEAAAAAAAALAKAAAAELEQVRESAAQGIAIGKVVLEGTKVLLRVQVLPSPSSSKHSDDSRPDAEGGEGPRLKLLASVLNEDEDDAEAEAATTSTSSSVAVPAVRSATATFLASALFSPSGSGGVDEAASSESSKSFLASLTVPLPDDPREMVKAVAKRLTLFYSRERNVMILAPSKR